MTDFIISPKFNKNNFLEIHIKNISKKKIFSFKICFSLIYSIKSISGAKIHKQIGRYYELNLNQSKFNSNVESLIVIELQTPRTSSYNSSCGPEGIFIIDNNDQLIKSKLLDLTFDKVIPLPNYSEETIDTLMPIIPEPNIINLNNNFVSCGRKYFISDSLLSKIATKLIPITDILEIYFNSSEGFEIEYRNIKLNLDEYKIEILKDKIIIYASSYGGKHYALISLIHLIFSFNVT